MAYQKKKKPMHDEQPSRNRLFTVVTCVLISAGILMMGLLFYRMQRTMLRQERQQMMAIAQSTARSMDNYISGCIAASTLVQRSPSFAGAVAAYRRSGGFGPVATYLDMLVSGEYSAVRDVYLLDDAGKMLQGTAEPGAYAGVVNADNPPGDGKLRIYTGGGKLYLGIVTTVDGAHLLTMIDAETLYHGTASFVTLGEKGYVMYKHSGGLILTHPVEEQIGTDVIGGRRSKYPNLDYTELERLIANQKKGGENIEVYHSYWWADEVPARVRKISAYTPMHVQNDFLIISAVTDYAELWRPILRSSAALIASGVLVTLGVTALFLNRRRNIQRQIKRENAYLKELTRSLDEMNRRQEELQHNQRLQLIGTLTGGIAHEFRNLLTPIMGYSGVLRESLPPDSPFREDIDEIHAAAARAKEIIRQITSLSRKNLDPALKPVRLDAFVPQVLKVVSTIKPSEVELKTDIDFGGCEIMGNKTQLQQIILNLCNNAFQALSENGGRLGVEGRTVGDGGADYAVLRFHDDGPGMKPEVVERIFDPFFTTKRVGEGTGLGLSIVQNLVDLHHGDIGVESEPGRGTTFTVRFPAALREAAASLKNGSAGTGGADEAVSIVLVDDDPQELRLLHRGLARSGFSTQAFDDPFEALKEMEQNPCRLLITGYELPRMSGMELAVRVRGSFKNTKILVLTSFADKEIFDFMNQEIIDGYQIKPAPVSELVEKINGLFAGNGGVREGGAMGGWDPDLYLKFRNERDQPARDLLNRIAGEEPGSIIDIGCGPGNSTRLLAERWPGADITGIDSSEAMIEKAKSDFSRRTWLVRDAGSGLADLGEFDLVFSNAALHWVPDHERTLPNLFSLVRPGGLFAAQVPNNGDSPIFAAIRELVSGDKWRGRFAAGFNEKFYEPPDEYYRRFSRLTPSLDMWESVYYHAMDRHEEVLDWLRGAFLRQYLDQLPDSAEKRDFENDLLALAKTVYKPRANGKILFSQRRLFITARKPQ